MCDGWSICVTSGLYLRQVNYMCDIWTSKNLLIIVNIKRKSDGSPHRIKFGDIEITGHTEICASFSEFSVTVGPNFTESLPAYASNF